ncbi:MAG: hypothetical protein WBE80_00395 [Methylocella sp.]
MPYSYPKAAEEGVYGLNIQILPRPIDGTAPDGSPVYTMQGDILCQMGPVAPNAAPVPLRAGESLYSPARAFRLTFQATDGNVVLQVVDTGNVPSNWPTKPKPAVDVPWTPIWASNTANQGAKELVFRDDGNMLILGGDNNILFQTNTGSYPQAFFRMQDDGNLVIYEQGGQPVWSSKTSAGEAPGANA